jgi:hypothetical protein
VKEEGVKGRHQKSTRDGAFSKSSAKKKHTSQGPVCNSASPWPGQSEAPKRKIQKLLAKPPRSLRRPASALRPCRSHRRASAAPPRRLRSPTTGTPRTPRAAGGPPAARTKASSGSSRSWRSGSSAT